MGHYKLNKNEIGSNIKYWYDKKYSDVKSRTDRFAEAVQGELYGSFGIERSYGRKSASSWFLGEHITIETLLSIANVLEVDIGALFGDPCCKETGTRAGTDVCSYTKLSPVAVAILHDKENTSDLFSLLIEQIGASDTILESCSSLKEIYEVKKILHEELPANMLRIIHEIKVESWMDLSEVSGYAMDLNAAAGFQSVKKYMKDFINSYNNSEQLQDALTYLANYVKLELLTFGELCDSLSFNKMDYKDCTPLTLDSGSPLTLDFCCPHKEANAASDVEEFRMMEYIFFRADLLISELALLIYEMEREKERLEYMFHKGMDIVTNDIIQSFDGDEKHLPEGVTIHEARKMRGKSIKDMADLMGVSSVTYAKYEKDPGAMSLRDIRKLSELLGISIDSLQM